MNSGADCKCGRIFMGFVEELPGLGQLLLVAGISD